ncbi:hypothetical protein C8J57DRAFT_1672747 [Mycena rebaudengoi]|nr:hypothetical protein C8J57DRAFT_1672747 [Mycena rebaudengoi]
MDGFGWSPVLLTKDGRRAVVSSLSAHVRRVFAPPHLLNVAPPPHARQQASLKHKFDGDDAEERERPHKLAAHRTGFRLQPLQANNGPDTAPHHNNDAVALHARALPLPKLVGGNTPRLRSLHPPPCAATVPYGTTLLESTPVASSVLAVGSCHRRINTQVRLVHLYLLHPLLPTLTHLPPHTSPDTSKPSLKRKPRPDDAADPQEPRATTSLRRAGRGSWPRPLQATNGATVTTSPRPSQPGPRLFRPPASTRPTARGTSALPVSFACPPKANASSPARRQHHPRHSPSPSTRLKRLESARNQDAIQLLQAAVATLRTADACACAELVALNAANKDTYGAVGYSSHSLMRAALPSGFRSTFGLLLFLLLFPLSDLQTLLHRFCFSFFSIFALPESEDARFS